MSPILRTAADLQSLINTYNDSSNPLYNDELTELFKTIFNSRQQKLLSQDFQRIFSYLMVKRQKEDILQEIVGNILKIPCGTIENAIRCKDINLLTIRLIKFDSITLTTTVNQPLFYYFVSRASANLFHALLEKTPQLLHLKFPVSVPLVQVLFEKMNSQERSLFFFQTNEKGQTLLHQAIIYDKKELAKLLLQQADAAEKEHLFKQDNEKNTPLHFIANKKSHFLHLLYNPFYEELCSDLSVRNEDGLKPCHIAAIHGDSFFFSYLIKGLTSKDRKNIFLCIDKEGRTPLNLATLHQQYQLIIDIKTEMPVLELTPIIIFHRDLALFSKKLAFFYQMLEFLDNSRSNLETIQWTILPERARQVLKGSSKQRALFLSPDCYSQTIAHIAAWVGASKTIDFLFKHITDKERSTLLMKDLNGNTPLHIAAKQNIYKLINIFFDQSSQEERANLLAPNHEGKNPLHLAIEGYSDLFIETLFHSVKEKDLKKKLLHSLDKKGSNILHLLAKSKNIYFTFNLIRSSIINSLDVIHLVVQKDHSGLTPLYVALLPENMHVNFIKCIFDKVSFDQSIYLLMQHLEIAISQNQPKLFIDLLNCFPIEERMRLHQEGRDKGYLPMRFAVLSNHVACVRDLFANSLLAEYPFFFEADHEGKTVLHLATQKKYYYIVQELLNHASIDQRWHLIQPDKDGNTPLHIAAKEGCTAVFVSLFLDNATYAERALLLDKNEDGSNPLQLALLSKSEDFANGLLREVSTYECIMLVDSLSIDIHLISLNPGVKILLCNSPSLRRDLLKQEMDREELQISLYDFIESENQEIQSIFEMFQRLVERIVAGGYQDIEEISTHNPLLEQAISFFLEGISLLHLATLAFLYPEKSLSLIPFCLEWQIDVMVPQISEKRFLNWIKLQEEKESDYSRYIEVATVEQKEMVLPCLNAFKNALTWQIAKAKWEAQPVDKKLEIRMFANIYKNKFSEQSTYRAWQKKLMAAFIKGETSSKIKEQLDHDFLELQGSNSLLAEIEAWCSEKESISVTTPEEFIDPITCQVMQVPLRFPDTLHVFDESTLNQSEMNRDREGVKEYFDPLTRGWTPVSRMLFDRKLQEKIKNFLETTKIEKNP